MSKSSLYRAAADSNPTQLQHLPQEPTGLQFPLRMSTWSKGDWWQAPFCLLVLLGVNFFWVTNAINQESDPRSIVMITSGISVFVLLAKYQLRVALPVGVVLLIIQAAVFATFTGYYDWCELLTAVAFAASCGLAIEFNKFFKRYAITGYYSDKERKAYLDAGTVPAGVKAEDAFNSFVLALQIWLTYDKRKSLAVGIHKPQFSYHKRHRLTLLVVVLWMGACLTHELPEALGQPDRFLPLLGKLFFIPVFAPFIIAYLLMFRSVARAAGVLKKRFDVERWGQFVESVRNAKNQTISKSVYLGKVHRDGSPVMYPISAFDKPIWIQGSPGSGKTVLLSQVMEQLIAQGVSVVTMDLKATSHELLHGAKEAAQRVKTTQGRDVPVHAFTTRNGDATQHFNLFQHKAWSGSSPEEKAGMMLGFMGLNHGNAFGESYFRDSSWTVQQHLLDKYPNVTSFHEAATLLAEELKHAREPWELSAASKKDGEHPRLILRRLGMLDAMNVRPGYSQEILDAAIDLESLFLTPSVLHCSLPAVSDPIGNPEVGRVILSALLRVGASMAKRPVKVVVIIDEFQRMVSREIDIVLQQARSLGIGIILTNQSSADLQAVDSNLVDTIAACSQLQAWMRTTDNLGKQQIIDFGGQYIDKMHSTSVSSNSQGDSTSHSSSEHVFDRVSSGLIDSVNSNMGQYFLRITDNAGYAAYGSQMFVAQMDFHTTREEFERRSSAPWPAASKGMLVNGQHRPGNTPPPTSSLAPKTPKAPSSSWKPTKLGGTAAASKTPAAKATKLPPKS